MDQFQTARIRAERLSPDHLAELCAMHHDPRVMATIGGVRSDDATRNYLAANLNHWERHGYEHAPSTASQTAWALLGLMAVGEVDHPAVARGIRYLADTQGTDGFWTEPRYTATGFPRVFYLRYHGYPKFFPLWAMARYRNLKRANRRTVAFGM